MKDEQRTHAAQTEAQGNDNNGALAQLAGMIADPATERAALHRPEQATTIAELDEARLADAVLAVTGEDAPEPPNWATIERAALDEATAQGVPAKEAEPWADFVGAVVSGVMQEITDANVITSDTDVIEAVRAAHGQWQDGVTLSNAGHVIGGVVGALGLPDMEAARLTITPKAAAAIEQLARIIPAVDREPSEADVTRHMMTGEEPRSWTLDDLKRDRATSGEKAAGQQAAAVRDASAARHDPTRPRGYDLER